MTACLRVHTIGQCTFDLDGRLITPASDLLFGVALILTVRRGVTITRDALGDLLWDEPFEARDPHVLRQLLYRLRQSGFPLRERSDGLLGVDTSRWTPTASSDFSIERYHEELEHLHPARFGWLPGYRTETASLRRWIDDERLRIHGGIRRALHAALTAAEAQSDWRRVEGYAGHLLALEPDNEDAVHALATSCALHGSRLAALEVLDRFRETTEQSGDWMTLAAARLRRRVESLAEPIDEYGRPLPPIVGREGLRTALQQLIRALRTDAQSRVSIVSGVHGSGKSRLASEVGMFGRLAGARVCALPQVDAGARPLAAQLSSWLLDAPGASGASPDLLAELRDTVSEQPVSDRMPRAAVLADVLWAVADDAPLLIVIDGPGRADRQMLDGLLAALAAVRAPVLCVLLASPTVAGRVTTPTGLPLLRGELDALTDEESGQVVDAWAAFLSRYTQPSSEARARMVSHAGGNPRFLEQWVRHWVSTGSVERVPVAVLAGMEAVRGELSALSTPVGARRVAAGPLRDLKSGSGVASNGSQEGHYSRSESTTTVLPHRGHDSPSLDRSSADEILWIARRLVQKSEFSLANDAFDAVIRRSESASSTCEGLGGKAHLLALAGKSDEARSSLQALERLCGDPHLCSPQLAVTLARTYSAIYTFPSLVDVGAVVSTLATVCRRDDVSCVDRATIAVTLVKLDELHHNSINLAYARELLSDLAAAPGTSPLVVHEGLMCYETLNGNPAHAALHAEVILSRIGLFPRRPRTVRLLCNAATSLLFAGDVERAIMLHTVALKRAVKIRSRNETTFAHNRLAICHFDYGDRTTANRMAQDACRQLVSNRRARHNNSMFVAGTLISAIEGDIGTAHTGLLSIHQDRKEWLSDHSASGTLALLSENAIHLALAMRLRHSIQRERLNETRAALLSLCARRPLDTCAAVVCRAIFSVTGRDNAQQFLAEYRAIRGRQFIKASRLLAQAISETA